MAARKPVGAFLSGPSAVDMLTDPENPPTMFSHEQWCEVRDALFRIGHRESNNPVRHKCKRISLAMNLVQEFYGTALSVVGHQCGRLFTERVVVLLIGRSPTGPEDTQSKRIRELSEKPGFPPEIISHLRALNHYGNRVDHEALDDLLPEEKPDVVHRTFQVAQFALAKARTECVFGERCTHGPKACRFRHKQGEAV